MSQIHITFLLSLLLMSCTQISSEGSTKQQVTIKTEQPAIIRFGYCPTMGPEAHDVYSGDPSIQMMEFSDSGEVLNQLRLGNIDRALIGRKAYTHELPYNTDEVQIPESGYTLIASQKGFIEQDKLSNIPVYTCHSELVSEIYPDLRIIFQECDYHDGNVWLISWSEFSDDHKLLVPIDRYGQKNRTFRSPFLYIRSF